MTSKTLVSLMVSAALYSSAPVVFADDIDDLKKEIAQMRADYEQRIQQLEQRLVQAETKTESVANQVKATPLAATTRKSDNSFNPAISMVLNGTFAEYGKEDDYEIDGFTLAGEGGLTQEGFSLGESELTVSTNIDQLFYGQATVAFHEHEGATELEIEEAFIETLGLSNGLTVRAGRYFAPIGYLNEKHIHAWNFVDAPLIYRGLFGNQLGTDGVKLSYLLPTDMMIELGGSAGAGNHHPGSGEHSGVGDWLLYAKTGGDIGVENSWQLSVSHWQASPDDRSYGAGHSHGTEEAESVTFSGDTDITNLSFIYKWAPNGNFRQRNFTLLTEYFYLNDDGSLSHADEFALYDGEQYGGFIEGIVQFNPQWRSGLRYDWLGSDHSASDEELLADADLIGGRSHPQRTSAMVEWLPSEFSRVRGQINYDQSYQDQDDWQFLLQYTVSLGAHGAHQY